VAERLAIKWIGRFGDGVAEGAGGAVYVPGALPGETVEVEAVAGHPDRRRLLRVEAASGERIAPICPHFGVCGGCAVQHWEATRYRAWKRGVVVDALRLVGLDPPVRELIDAHGEGRRRVVLHARRGSHGVLEVGFSAARAHRIVAIDRCPVMSKDLAGAIRAAWAIADALDRTGKSLDIQATATDAGLDIDLRGSGPLTAPTVAALAAVADTYDLARLTRHGELIALARTPTVRMGKATVPLPPGAFLQATAAGEEVLARLALEFCGGASSVADLFAGVGPFTLRIAERARVLAVDNEEAALAALNHAAAATPGLKPVAVERRDLFRRPLTAVELQSFTAVLFDPPRQGAAAQARELAASGVPRIIALSCNPGTFARDVHELVAGGYRLVDVAPVDQFRYAAHVEIAARLER
jgi:23S rRNA (uracil1939-C5)-methyltransferase